MHINRTELEETLRSQMDSCEIGNFELRKKLDQNWNWYRAQVEQTERAVAEQQYRADLADDYLYIRAVMAVRSARKFILTDAELRTALKQVRTDYRNRLREICSGAGIEPSDLPTIIIA